MPCRAWGSPVLLCTAGLGASGAAPRTRCTHPLPSVLGSGFMPQRSEAALGARGGGSARGALKLGHDDVPSCLPHDGALCGHLHLPLLPSASAIISAAQPCHCWELCPSTATALPEPAQREWGAPKGREDSVCGIPGAFRVQACHVCASRLLGVCRCLTFMQSSCGPLASMILKSHHTV